jgi:hypothetical protein
VRCRHCTPSAAGPFLCRLGSRFDESTSVRHAITAPNIQTLYAHRALIGVPPVTLEAFAQEVGSVWRIQERPIENFADWLDFFRTTCDELGQCLVDTPDEPLPDGELEIWRGVSAPQHMKGLGWTLDREKAICFASRDPILGERPRLYRALAKRDDVLAYFNTLQEAEIVIDPNTLSITEEQI